ncbi:hypothetical protein NHX12_016847 [Muraenolepis orangiensis]|uniref:Reverse transcriptase n=1 Tax=Muraenolepis orangiensis TaxID=630683 RepID=A0A9Q0I0T3_9TELE|nr:hypothetical protein NHX12_016845 [Muraenolepis orangiensis]KAJ3581261.1 hypothetical protein NHX12_016846 [Muraenolepis orangiensis]KAJ3581262.1 hypothetical protein NHX12_016847 [Muraenolepis orangiensis]
MKNHCLLIEELKKIDRLILASVRSWFSFPKSLSNNIFYTPTSLGGLGLRNLHRDYVALRLATALNVVNSRDERIQKIARKALVEIVDKRSKSTLSPIDYLHLDKELIVTKDIRSLLSSIRLNRKSLLIDLEQVETDDPASIDLDLESLMIPPNLQLFRRQHASRIKRLRWHVQKSFLNKWKAQLDQGRTIECFSHLREANSWLRTGQIDIRTYRFAVMGRANTLPTKYTLKKRQLTTSTKCRRCPCDVETIGHVLNGCKHGCALIQLRHNDVVKMISEAVKPKKDWTLRLDQTVPDTQSNRRPDIVLLNLKEKKAVIADITICYEANIDRMDQVREHKIMKYETEANILRDQGFEVHCTALVYGSLGSHHPLNIPQHPTLQLNLWKAKRKTFLKNLTKTILESSYKIWKNHVHHT